MALVQRLVPPILGLLLVTAVPFHKNLDDIIEAPFTSGYNATIVNTDCKGKCRFADGRMECIDCYPGNLSSTVNDIVLLNFNESRFVPKMFCSVSWPRVINLTIINIHEGKCYLSNFSIQNFTFDCLHRIEILKLRLSHLMGLSHNALLGLDNVRTLDLTDCICLSIPGLTPALSLETNIPLLQSIILSHVGNSLDGIQISQDFVNIIARKKITYFDVSSSNIRFASQRLNIDGICKSVRTLSLANSRLLYAEFDQPATCDSLRVLDVSGITPTGTPIYEGNITIPPGDYRFVGDNEWINTTRTISTLYANALISADHSIYSHNVTFNLQINNSLSELHISGYNVPVCEITFQMHPNYLTYFDLSNNRIERLSTNSFSYLVHLKKIDLSHNKLGVSMQSKDTFSSIFRNNSRLETTNLANNMLIYLPSNVFASNAELKQIDISSNKITQIMFEIEHLQKLELLDLMDNSIEYLDDWSRQQIDLLYKKKHVKMENKTFQINLRNNPFSCKCQSLDFLIWFVHSPVFADTKILYHCEVDSKRIPMNAGAIEASQYDCDRPKRELRKLLLSVLLPCASCGILMFISIVLFKRYKRHKMLRRLRHQIRLIHDDHLQFKFPVFLSYSSEDSEFVEPNILQPLENQLKNLTNCDRNLVAIGDRYFRLGRSIFAEIIRMLEDCAVFVVVLSKNYCDSDYCKHEIEQARLMRKPIVIIMKEFVDEGDMNGVIKETFKHFTRAVFRFDGEDPMLQQDWEYICESILLLCREYM